MPTSTTILEPLQSIPISTLLQQSGKRAKDIVAVHEEETLEDVLTLLRDANVLAVPVWKESDDGGGRVYTGIVSVYDILAWTVFQKVFDDLSPTDVDQYFEKYGAAMEEQHEYFHTKVKTLVSTSYASESIMLHSHLPISQLISALTLVQHHRVLVIDDDAQGSDQKPGSRITICTQTDAVRYLLSRLDKGESGKMEDGVWGMSCGKVSDVAGRGKGKAIITVPDTSSALEAFRIMHNNQVTAIAIVNAEGQIEANISGSDLRGITSCSLEPLLDKMWDFLETGTKRKADQLKPDQLRAVPPETTLEAAVRMMLEARIHRVWIVDDSEQPIGVVTLPDALTMFLAPANEA
ncbi:hypothetical protein HDV00_001445 [Rhizophlyctis rosea]|nr:hypothetical protein HDV00_001445 [Rhizophlyctis rosea]